MSRLGTAAALLAGTLYAREAHAEVPNLAEQMKASLDAGDADAAFANCGAAEVGDKRVQDLCDLIRKNYVLLEDYPNDGKRNTLEDALRSNGIQPLQAAGWYTTIAANGPLGLARVSANYNAINDQFFEKGPATVLAAKALLQSHKLVEDPNGGLKAEKELEEGYAYFYEGSRFPLYCEQDEALGIEVCRTDFPRTTQHSSKPTDWKTRLGHTYVFAVEQDVNGEILERGTAIHASGVYMPENVGVGSFIQFGLEGNSPLFVPDRLGVTGHLQKEIVRGFSPEVAFGPIVNLNPMYATEFGSRLELGFEWGFPLADRYFYFHTGSHLDVLFDRGEGSPIDQFGVNTSLQVPVAWR